jgi:hypothetical protein
MCSDLADGGDVGVGPSNYNRQAKATPHIGARVADPALARRFRNDIGAIGAPNRLRSTLEFSHSNLNN